MFHDTLLNFRISIFFFFFFFKFRKTSKLMMKINNLPQWILCRVDFIEGHEIHFIREIILCMTLSGLKTRLDHVLATKSWLDIGNWTLDVTANIQSQNTRTLDIRSKVQCSRIWLWIFAVMSSVQCSISNQPLNSSCITDLFHTYSSNGQP